jgi:carbonic anhydrase/acetyltransferase-like protein (isoleucine patch superfamily)
MRVLHAFGEWTPHLEAEVYVAPSASVIGRVRLGRQSSVWFGAVLRGDVGPIEVGARTNIQDQSVLHVTEGASGTFVGDDVVIGHRAIVHECRIEDLALIGMGSVLLDGCVIGRGAIVAAGAVIRAGQQVPELALVAGVPAEVRKILPASSIEARRAHARQYVELARRYRESR